MTYLFLFAGVANTGPKLNSCCSNRYTQFIDVLESLVWNSLAAGLYGMLDPLLIKQHSIFLGFSSRFYPYLAFLQLDDVQMPIDVAIIPCWFWRIDWAEIVVIKKSVCKSWPCCNFADSVLLFPCVYRDLSKYSQRIFPEIF